MASRNDALRYHALPPAGKIEIRPTKPALTQRDLTLAYTPGVAEPCREIEKDPEKVFEYTAKGNLVAVVTNGTAVLGLGNIGPAAGKPVMEGKAVLFKRFAGIDVFDIELDAPDVESFCQVGARRWRQRSAASTSRTCKAPECFTIEERSAARSWTSRSSTTISTAPRSSSAAGLVNAMTAGGARSMEDAKHRVLRCRRCGAGHRAT